MINQERYDFLKEQLTKTIQNINVLEDYWYDFKKFNSLPGILHQAIYRQLEFELDSVAFYLRSMGRQRREADQC